MQKVNQDILNKLKSRTTWDDASEDLKDRGHSVNGIAFITFIRDWDNTDTFPHAQAKELIRFHEWTKKEFEDFEYEMLVKKYLPEFLLDVFFEMKDFRSNPQNMLTSDQRTYARLYARDCKNQDERADLIYDWAYSRFYEESEIRRV